MSKVRLILMSLLGVLAVSAVAASTASAVAMPAVTDAAGNSITNHLEILALKIGNAVLKSKLAGVNIEIVCEHEHVEGWILERGEHYLGYSLAHYLKCTMPKPAAGLCKVHNELIHVSTHVLILLGSGGPGTFKEEFTPEGNPYFALITVEGCSNSAINGTYEVNGTAVAESNNTTLELNWTETSGSSLKLGGNAATYIDNIKPEMLGGGGLMLENEN